MLKGKHHTARITNVGALLLSAVFLMNTIGFGYGQNPKDDLQLVDTKAESYLIQAFGDCKRCVQHVILRLADISTEKIEVLIAQGLNFETLYGNYVYGTIDFNGFSRIIKLQFVEFVSAQGHAYETATISQGLPVLRADFAQAGGLAGAGVKVAVLDQGFDVTNPEIQNNIKEFKNFRANGTNTPQHGTAVSEVIVDVAPNVELYLYVVFYEAEIMQAIDLAITRGAKIISMSLGMIGIAPHDGTSAISKKFEEARANGVIPIISAGNEGLSHWKETFTDPNRNGWHNYQGTTERNAVIYGTASFCAILIWDDWPFSNQDYDLYLYDSGNIVASSTTAQVGTQPPGEALCFTPPPGAQSAGKIYDLAIRNRTATRKVNLELFVYQGSLTRSNATGSIGIPADARGAIAVGAIHWNSGSRPSIIIELYSSRGPTMDGRTKPDVIAPTCVSTTSYGTLPFCGTSASAPHTAGAAALLLSGNPSLTSDDIQTLLEKGAVDLGQSGKDNTFGSGGVRVTTVSFDVNPRPGSITVDGIVYPVNSFQKIFVWKPGSSHAAFANPIQATEDTRQGFKEWSTGSTSLLSQITYDGTMLTLVASYDTEYRVRADSLYGVVQGAGWYLKGKQAAISVNAIEDHKNSTRRVFTGWSGSIQSSTPTMTFTVDSPKTLSASWKKQYEVVAIGPFNTSPGGWYDVGTRATISAPPATEHGNATKHLFDQWTGDTSTRNSTISIVVDSPKKVSASYKTQYFVNIASSFASTNGSGWYFRGTEAKILVTNSTFDHGNLTRRVFDGWSSGITIKEPSGAIVVDTPKNISAQWIKQYFVKLVSDFGQPSGDGWHNANSAVQISIEPLISQGNRTRRVFSQWSADQSVQTLEVARASVVASRPVVVEAKWRTQYELQVSDRAFLASKGDLWFDRFTTTNLGFFHTVNGTGDRGNLLAYAVDDGSRVPVTRRASGIFNLTLSVEKPRTISLMSVTQYLLRTSGGSIVSVTPSPTLDSWYDSGNRVAVSTDSIWDVITKVSRKSLVSFSIDGTIAQITRSEVRFTAPEIPMTKSREFQFVSTDQFWVEVTSDFGNPRGTGWADRSSKVEVSVEPVIDHGNRTRRVFLSWRGEQTISENRITQTIETPKSYVATWQTQFSHAFSFADKQGRIIRPEKVALAFGGTLQNTTEIDKTWVDKGSFSLQGVYWRGANVGPAQSQEFLAQSPQEIAIPTRVYDLVLSVKDGLGIPVPFSSVKIGLANGSTLVAQTAFDGTLRLVQLPLENYDVTVDSFGQIIQQRVNATDPPSSQFRLGVSLPIIGPIVVTVAIVVALVLRKRKTKIISY